MADSKLCLKYRAASLGLCATRAYKLVHVPARLNLPVPHAKKGVPPSARLSTRISLYAVQRGVPSCLGVVKAS